MKDCLGQSGPILVHLSLRGMSSSRIGMQNRDISIGGVSLIIAQYRPGRTKVVRIAGLSFHATGFTVNEF
jgi:hypothetical protein